MATSRLRASRSACCRERGQRRLIARLLSQQALGDQRGILGVVVTHHEAEIREASHSTGTAAGTVPPPAAIGSVDDSVSRSIGPFAVNHAGVEGAVVGAIRGLRSNESPLRERPSSIGATEFEPATARALSRAEFCARAASIDVAVARCSCRLLGSIWQASGASEGPTLGLRSVALHVGRGGEATDARS